MAMVLSVASLMAILSCSKDNDSSKPVETLRDVSALVGEWQCTWSAGNSDYNIAENAYVGTLWRFGAPAANNDQYLGDFAVALDGNYPDGVSGEYHFYGDGYWLPRLLVWISEDNGFMWFNGFHENKPGDHYSYNSNYWVVLTDNTMNLYRFEENVDNLSDAELVLKYKKIR